MGIILHGKTLKNPKLELIIKLNKLPENKVNKQKSCIFLYTTKEKCENEIENWIYTIKKRMKHKIIWLRSIKFDTEYYKTALKEILKDLNKWKDILIMNWEE